MGPLLKRSGNPTWHVTLEKRISVHVPQVGSSSLLHIVFHLVTSFSSLIKKNLLTMPRWSHAIER
jgi:hypothetical protein